MPSAVTLQGYTVEVQFNKLLNKLQWHPLLSSSIGPNLPDGWFFKNINLFIWLYWVLVAAPELFSCGMWDLSSLTKDWTPVPYIGSMES